MNVSLYQAASALNANSRWQDMIADNIASASVPGYKKQQLTIAAVQAGIMPSGRVGSGNSPHTFVIPKVSASTNFSSGEMRPTGVNTDLAIDGKAFFGVQMPNGTTAYTRDGEFQVNSQGLLVTKAGYPVLGAGGPIQLNPRDTGSLTISANGDVSQGPARKGKIALAEFDKPELLTQGASGYFTADNPSIRPQASTSTIRQGYVEGSNTSTVVEMSNLMTAMRGFETNQKVIQMQDDRLGKAISDLGNPA